MTLIYSYFGLPNTPPVISGVSPTGNVPPTSAVSFTITSERGTVEQSSINLELQHQTLPITLYPIINGVIQSGYSGSITSDGAGGWTVSITDDDGFQIAGFDAVASCADTLGETDSETWSVTFVSTIYHNRVYDTSINNYVRWETAAEDSSGVSYPGPGTFGVDTQDYCVEFVEVFSESYRNRVWDPIDQVFVSWETNTPDTIGTSYPGSSLWSETSDYCIEQRNEYASEEFGGGFDG